MRDHAILIDHDWSNPVLLERKRILKPLRGSVMIREDRKQEIVVSRVRQIERDGAMGCVVATVDKKNVDCE